MMQKSKKCIRSALLCLAAVLLAACAQESPAPEEPAPTPVPEEPVRVEISEVMPSNKSSLADGQGAFSDWVELYNPGPEAAELEGCRLICGGDSWALSSLRLEPGEYRLLFCSQAERFSLPARGGELRLESAGGVTADSVSLPAAQADVSYIRGENGQLLPAAYCSPGYENSPEGYAQSQAALSSASPLQINEVMVYNDRFFPVEGETYDWVELKNVSGQPLELGQYALADKSGERYPLPERSLEPGELVLVFCTGGEAEGAPFALNAAEERLFLTDGSGMRDYVHLKGLPYGGSYGRLPGENGFFFFDTPSPGEENSGGARLVTARPEASLQSGVYEDVDQVTVTLTAPEGGEIYYTLDGSDPGPDGQLYTGPITLTETGVVRAAAVREGALLSESLDLSYILNEGHSLPVLSLVMDPSSLFGSRGIYSRPTQDWERPGSLAFFEEDGGFCLGCGVKLHGATSRIAQDKKSFKIKFKDRYEGGLDYDLFENGVTSFESILLRAAQESHFSSLMRDNLMHQVAIEQFPELPAQDSKYAVLYINGAYWGIYNIREAHSAKHFAEHYGYDEDQVEQYKGSWPKNGPSDQIYHFALDNDLRDDENYAAAAQHLNIESVIGWIILEAYASNEDINSPNMRFYYSSEDDRTSFALVDLDLGMFTSKGLRLPLYFGYAYNKLAQSLADNWQFRDRLLTEMGQALEGPLSDKAMLARIDELAAQLRPELPKEGDRWNWDLRYWERQVDAIRFWVSGRYPSRARILVWDAQRTFGLSDEEVQQYFGRALELNPES